MRWMLGPLALIAGIGAAQAQVGAQLATPQLATGEVLLHIETVGVAPPDAATVGITVQGSGADDASARAALKAARSRVMAQLAKLGVPANAVSAGEVTVNEDYALAVAASVAAAGASEGAVAAAAEAGAAAAEYADVSAATDADVDAALAAADAAAADVAAEGVVDAMALPDLMSDAAAPTARRANQTLTITVTDLTRLAAVESVQTLSSVGDVIRYSRSRANFYTTDPKAAYGRAVQLALANARTEAEAYAAALGYRVVRVVSVSSAKPGLNLPDVFGLIGRADARGTPAQDELKRLSGSVIAGAQIDYVIAPK